MLGSHLKFRAISGNPSKCVDIHRYSLRSLKSIDIIGYFLTKRLPYPTHGAVLCSKQWRLASLRGQALQGRCSRKRGLRSRRWFHLRSRVSLVCALWGSLDYVRWGLRTPSDCARRQFAATQARACNEARANGMITTFLIPNIFKPELQMHHPGIILVCGAQCCELHHPSIVVAWWIYIGLVSS